MTAKTYDNSARDAIVRDLLSPINWPLAVTFFPSQQAFEKTEERLSLKHLAKRIATTYQVEKADLPWLKLATFGDERTRKNSLRSNANMLTVSGVEIDYDGGPVTPELARGVFAMHDLACLIYTTPRHGIAGNRWRALFICSTELPPDRRAPLVARAKGLLDDGVDDASFTPSQSFYFGTMRGGEPVKTYLVDGKTCIDLADDLDTTAKGRSDKGDRERESGEGSGEKTGRPSETIREALFAIPNDGSNPDVKSRQQWLEIGMALHHETDGGEEGFEAFDEWSQQHPTYDADKTRAAWDSAGRKSGRIRTARHILALARKHGWRDIEGESAKFDDLPEDDDDREEETEPEGDLLTLTPGQCADMPPRDYVVKRLLAPGDVSSIFGVPGVGKSLVAPLMAYMVAQGEPFFGLRTKQGKVLYVATEDGAGLQMRVTALRERYGDADDFILVPNAGNIAKGKPHFKSLVALIQKHKPKGVFIDTLAEGFPGLEENDAASMGGVVKTAKALASHGPAVILVHHSTKEDSPTPRGHSVLNGALYMGMHLQLDETSGVVRGSITKNKNGPRDIDIAFRIGTVTLGEDDDGDEITAALADPCKASGKTEKRSNLTGAEKAAYRHLLDLTGTRRDGVTKGDWIKVCADGRTVSANDDRKLRWQAAHRAILGLTRKRYVLFQDDRYFVESKYHDFPHTDSEDDSDDE